MTTAAEDYWVFAYGSLIWNPEFPYIDKAPALLRGYHRSFCLYSWHYRGTRDRPGLVLGLDRGGSCRGVVFRVAAADAAQAKELLWEREMIGHAYRPVQVPVAHAGGRVTAQTFVVLRDNPQYAGGLDPESTARLIATSCGDRGANTDYLWNTVAHLHDMGIADAGLDALARRVRELCARGCTRPELPRVEA